MSESWITQYLTLVEILAMHETLVDRYGGLHGLRNEGGLESALNRPQTGYYNDIIEEAAALWESLSQNHPFVDGNKRVAFAAVYTFLAANGVKLTANPAESFTFIDGMLNSQKFEFKELNAWLGKNTDKLT
jgi:death-on-curing protein